MNKTLGISLIVVAVLVLATGSFIAGTIYSRSNTWMMGNYANNSAYGPGGMMNIMGGMTNMMGGNGSNNSNLVPVTAEQAKSAAEKYLANLKNDDLKIVEIMIFDNNAYVVVKEASTGVGAFELLVDSSSQTAYPEHGPNMMWNLKYGALNHQSMMGNNSGMMDMMGGNSGMTNMMNGYTWDDITSADVSLDMTITPEQAIQLAQKYLDKNFAGETASSDPIQFYGYYTLDFEKDGKVAGMLSVNGFSGQVFFHTWHGSFIEETELE
jgi:hypothetical protein